MLRSYLFAPGNNEKLLTKVFSAGADAVVLDLEDAVSPADKETARRLTAQTLKQQVAKVQPRIFVRINAVGSPWWREDLRSVVQPNISGIRLPKAESLEQVRQAAFVLEECEAHAGMKLGSVRLVCTIESAAGVLAAAEMARHSRVAGFTFGAADFLTDIGGEADARETATLFARSQLVLISRAAGIAPPVAAVYTNVTDLDGLRHSTVTERNLGFFGRSCIHPRQVPVVNEVFTPTAAQLAQARAIVAAHEEAQAAGSAVTVLPNGEFVDRPVVLRAQALLALDEALRLKEPQSCT